MTHVQALQISMKFILQVASDKRILKTFQFRNKKQKCNPDFLFILVFAESLFYIFKINLSIIQVAL